MTDVKVFTDRKRYDAFVAERAPQAFFQDWQWGVVQERMGSPVMRFGYYRGTTLAATAACAVVRARRGNYLHVRHGPVVDMGDTTLFADVTGHLRGIAKTHACSYIRISPLVPDTADNALTLKTFGYVPSAIHAMDAERCWVLDIAPTEETIMAGMRKTTRYEIRRAPKVGVTVTQSTATGDMGTFLSLYAKTAARQGFVGHHGIAEEFETYASSGQAALFFGEHEGTILSAALIVFTATQAIYRHGASVPSNIPASYLVQWEAIREAKRRGIGTYNFWGIAPDDNPRHPWKGLTLFKKGFGGSEVSYLHAHDLPVSSGYALSRGIDTVRRVLKGY